MTRKVCAIFHLKLHIRRLVLGPYTHSIHIKTNTLKQASATRRRTFITQIHFQASDVIISSDRRGRASCIIPSTFHGQHLEGYYPKVISLKVEKKKNKNKTWKSIFLCCRVHWHTKKKSPYKISLKETNIFIVRTWCVYITRLTARLKIFSSNMTAILLSSFIPSCPQNGVSFFSVSSLRSKKNKLIDQGNITALININIPSICRGYV